MTHRAVARWAALPLAATTYYFASLQDLRDEALVHLADWWIERGQAVVRSLPPRLGDPEEAARAVVGVVIGHSLSDAAPREHLLAMYERYLEAGRHPRLRPFVVAYNDQLADLIQEVLRRGGLPSSPQDVRLALAVVDGALLTALAEGEPPDQTAATALVTLFDQIGATTNAT